MEIAYLQELLWKSYDQASVKDGLVGALYNRANVVKRYQKTEKKWEKELKSLKKQTNILFRMSKRSDSCCELKKIKKFKSKASKKNSKSSINIYISDLDSDSSLYI